MDSCLTSAEALRAGGEPAAALAELDRGLVEYPEALLLKKLRQILVAEIQAAQEGHIKELRAIESAAQDARTRSDVLELETRVRTIQHQATKDAAVSDLSNLAEAVSRTVSKRKRRLLLTRLAFFPKFAVAVPLGLIVLTTAIWFVRDRITRPPQQKVLVEVSSNPPGASIQIGDTSLSEADCANFN